MRRSLLALGVFCSGPACHVPTSPTDTSLAGTVVRGPTQPVCQVDAACEAPFGASFTAERNGRVIESFRSGADGRFEVRLSPGTYLIVPGPDAPILSPKSQAKEVLVGSTGTTTVLLRFDTGIR